MEDKRITICINYEYSYLVNTDIELFCKKMDWFFKYSINKRYCGFSYDSFAVFLYSNFNTKKASKKTKDREKEMKDTYLLDVSVSYYPCLKLSFVFSDPDGKIIKNLTI